MHAKVSLMIDISESESLQQIAALNGGWVPNRDLRGGI
jgi:hypothetical protein